MMHTYYRATVFAVLVLAVIANAAAHANRHHAHPAEPPAPTPSIDGDIEWGFRTFAALISAGLVSAIHIIDDLNFKLQKYFWIDQNLNFTFK